VQTEAILCGVGQESGGRVQDGRRCRAETVWSGVDGVVLAVASIGEESERMDPVRDDAVLQAPQSTVGRGY